MIKALLRLARAFTGLWSEVRAVRRLIEWAFVSGLSGSAQIPALGRITFTIDPINLPPSAKESAESAEDKFEVQQLPDEEDLAADRAAEVLKKRWKGERPDDDDPSLDWDLL